MTITELALIFSLLLNPGGIDPFEPIPPWENPHTPYDGYIDRWGDWVPGYISQDTWWDPAPKHIMGAAVFYAPGVMRATAEYRGLNLDGYLGGVAMMSPADIGQTVWLKLQGQDWEGPYLVVDCARRGDMWPIIMRRGEVVEVDFATAERWGMARLDPIKRWVAISWRMENVQVFKGHAPPHGLVKPIDYRSWFYQNVEYATSYKPRRYVTFSQVARRLVIPGAQ